MNPEYFPQQPMYQMPYTNIPESSKSGKNIIMIILVILILICIGYIIYPTTTTTAVPSYITTPVPSSNITAASPVITTTTAAPVITTTTAAPVTITTTAAPVTTTAVLVTTTTVINGATSLSSGTGRINNGEYITSQNKKYSLIMQGDNNLVLYNGSTYIWSTGTSGQGKPGTAGFFIQQDGKLIVSDANTQILWHTDISINLNSSFRLQDNGNLVVCGPYGNPFWSSNTGV